MTEQRHMRKSACVRRHTWTTTSSASPVVLSSSKLPVVVPEATAALRAVPVKPAADAVASTTAAVALAP